MNTRLTRPVLVVLMACMVAIGLVASERDAAASLSSKVGKPEQVILDPTSGGIDLQGGGYLSPITEAARPFTHMLLRWEATNSGGGALRLEVRASLDNQDWSDWVEVGIDPDLWVPDDGPDVSWSHIIYAGDGARFWQVRATITPDDDGTAPELRSITVNTVDGRYAKTDQKELDLAQNSIDLASLDKPPFITRTGWGNPDGQWSRVPPAYYPARHIIVHHTVYPNYLTNSESNWGDRIRAIWALHTFTRGWGDIGYNFLITPDGTIWEGRAGGDDAVGFHDTGNYGSMGVAMDGTYSTALPSAAARDSLVRLLAWKANQKGIDPLGRAYYYGCDISAYCATSGAVLYNISGHRHVANNPPGYTSCPGDALFAALPTIRTQVKERIDSAGTPTRPDNGDLIIDSLETTFARSDANWYAASCGYGGHTYYTYATNDPSDSTNSATWRPNLPKTGRYQVFAYVPQGCGLAAPPYATKQARYRVVSSEGAKVVTVDHNTAEEWVSLGTYTFNQGNSGAVELFDLTDEPYSQRKVMFFDAIRWVDVSDRVDLELVNVRYGDGTANQTLIAGKLLPVVFTLRNRGEKTVLGQDPQPTPMSDSTSSSATNGYVYDEAECFLGLQGAEYPAYPKETGRIRVTLGATNRTVSCAGDTGGYPWRWGIETPLAPGEQRDITGYVRFTTPGKVTLQAGLVEEYVRYHARDVAGATITVLPEQNAPVMARYGATVQPLAQVYRMGLMPDNLLARTRNAVSIVRGEYISSFEWNGQFLDWGTGGPTSLEDGFIVEQTRVFQAPVDGTYTFRTTSDDGSWLWIDGKEVVNNSGLHDVRSATGEIFLRAGVYSLSFKYFERTGTASAGYAVKLPESEHFVVIQDALSSTPRTPEHFTVSPEIVLAADDQGGSGLDHWQYSINDSQWIEVADSVLRLGRWVDGSYTLRYRVTDQLGNTSPTEEFRFIVDTRPITPTLPQDQRVYLPVVVGDPISRVPNPYPAP